MKLSELPDVNEFPRFMSEYADYQIAGLNANELMKEQIKVKGTESIKKSLLMYQKGMLSIAETMKLIADIF